MSFKILAQTTITPVNSTKIEHTSKEYGIKKLELLIYPSIEKIGDTISSKTDLKKCKAYVKLKINSKSKSVIQDTIVTTCNFKTEINIEDYFKTFVHFFVIKAITDDNENEVTIPILINNSKKN